MTTASAQLIPVNGHFHTGHLRDNLRRRSVRGGAITLFVQGSKFALKMISTVLLARLLTPNDYGLVAMVGAVIGFAAIFKDMGLSTATIQRPDVTHEQISILFWLNVLISLSVTLITAASGPLLAWLYHEPRLTMLTTVMSVTFLLGGLSVQHQALLARQMRFMALGVIEIVSMSVGIITGVLMARRGCGYWSLAGMTIATEVCDIALAFILCDWRPSLPRRGSGVGPMVRFGRNLTISGCFTYLSRNADNVLIGWYWGAAPLGLYSKAYQLFMLPLQQINAPVATVVLPALSRLHDDPERYRSYFIRMITLVNSLAMPMAMTLTVLSEETIRVTLGGQWMTVVPVFRVLSLGALTQSLTSGMGWLYLASGRTRALVRWTVISTIITVAAFAVGVPYGPLGVAVCYTAVRFLMLIPSLFVACHNTPVRVLDLARAVAQPACAAGVAGLTCWASKHALYAMGFGKWQVFLLAGSAAMLAAAATLALLFRNLKFYASLWSDLMPQATRLAADDR